VGGGGTRALDDRAAPRGRRDALYPAALVALRARAHHLLLRIFLVVTASPLNRGSLPTTAPTPEPVRLINFEKFAVLKDMMPAHEPSRALAVGEAERGGGEGRRWKG
jgi:hypothetical protein